MSIKVFVYYKVKILGTYSTDIKSHDKITTRNFITLLKNISYLYILIVTLHYMHSIRYCPRSNHEYCRVIFNVQSCVVSNHMYKNKRDTRHCVFSFKNFSAILNLITIIDSISYAAQIK